MDSVHSSVVRWVSQHSATTVKLYQLYVDGPFPSQPCGVVLVQARAVVSKPKRPTSPPCTRARVCIGAAVCTHGKVKDVPSVKCVSAV